MEFVMNPNGLTSLLNSQLNQVPSAIKMQSLILNSLINTYNKTYIVYETHLIKDIRLQCLSEFMSHLSIQTHSVQG